MNTRGLTTSPIPYRGGTFEIQFDLVHHRLEVKTADRERAFALAPQSVAAFYRELFFLLHGVGIEVQINRKPQEVANPILFDQDETHKSYDPVYANRLWRILRSTDIVLQEFRARFIGKSSPVHFFWGSFDLCCTRFNGRRAPARKGVISSESYSHECSSVGWWPGGGDIAGPAFYAYMAPEPEACGEQKVRPASALYQGKLREFLLMYDDVRRATSPRDEILSSRRAPTKPEPRLPVGTDWRWSGRLCRETSAKFQLSNRISQVRTSPDGETGRRTGLKIPGP